MAKYVNSNRRKLEELKNELDILEDGRINTETTLTPWRFARLYDGGAIHRWRSSPIRGPQKRGNWDGSFTCRYNGKDMEVEYRDGGSLWFYPLDVQPIVEFKTGETETSVPVSVWDYLRYKHARRRGFEEALKAHLERCLERSGK